MSDYSGRFNLQTLRSDLLDLVWPRICCLCSAAIELPDHDRCICSTCRVQLFGDSRNCCPRCSSTVGPHADVSNGCPRCRKFRFRFSGVVRLGEYDGLLRDAVLRMKHDSGELLAERVGELFAVERRAELLASKPDAIVPIPLHWQRRWKRGYDQAATIARGISRMLNIASHPGTLARTRATDLQAGSSATARWDNVRGAFRAVRAHRLHGKKILLVDDVLTTGATADAAAEALLSAGAAQVSVAVLAHR